MKSFKPLIKFDGKSFVVNITEKLSAVCDKTIIVTGFKAHEVLSEFNISGNKDLCKRTKFVFNKNFHLGMFSSIQAGLKKCESADWVLLHFVDQPGLPLEFYSEFTKQIQDKFDWVQPVQNGRKGHPVLIGKKIVRDISDSAHDGNLREISHNAGIKKKLWECNFPQIFTDIDTPEDYRKLGSASGNE